MQKIKLFRKLFIATACFLFAANANLRAQTIDDAYASLTGQNNSFTVTVSDTTGISEVEVRLGSELAGSDIILHSFSYDSQPSSPYSYSRTGNQINLGIGSITLSDMYYGEVRLKDSNGNWGSPFQFVSN